jgi:predicted choloylglycine hydrolase
MVIRVATTFTFRAIEELEPGPRWQALFAELLPSYRAWFLHEGEHARPSYAASLRMLRTHMPELVPTYERLVQLAGGGDLEARMLSMWTPPPYLTGCSQGVWTRGEPMLVRNYDYSPARFDGVVLSTAWTGRRVIGMSDSLWGLLDGINDAGLVVSLAFCGRRVVGPGFGVPLIVRYLLEVCETVAEARAALERVPCHLAHTLTLADRSGDVLTAYLSPDRGAVFSPVAAATNHQGEVEWGEHAAFTNTREREQCIVRMLEDEALSSERFVGAFLSPPLHNHAYSRGFGTLYAAAYRPREGRVDYLWPGSGWRHSFARVAEGTHVATLVEPSAA